MNARILPVPTITQYEAPFCLYACTSMVLSCFGITRSISEISYEVSLDWPGDSLDAFLGELVGAVTDYLGDNGLEARYQTDGDWDRIKSHIDRGHPVIAFVKPYAGDALINHAWVIRGYDDAGAPAIVYNNPRNDPGSDDPAAFDADGSGTPGETMDFRRFSADYWSGPPGPASRAYIAVSYKGQGTGRQHRNWRDVGTRSFGRCRYHMARMTRKLRGLELAETVTESLVSAVAFVGLVIGGVQLIGQAVTAAGAALADIGGARRDRRGLGGRAAGVLLHGVAAVPAAVGNVIDVVAGFLGLLIDAMTSAADAAGSVFTGAAGGSASVSLGDTEVDLGLALKVHPWETRWGNNWERISGSWAVATADAGRLDRLEIRWRVHVWGWRLDSWSLGHRAIELAGTMSENRQVRDDAGDKRFLATITDARRFRAGFGEATCPYRRGGAIIRVRLAAEVRATRGADQATMRKSVAIWGISA